MTQGEQGLMEGKRWGRGWRGSVQRWAASCFYGISVGIDPCRGVMSV